MSIGLRIVGIFYKTQVELDGGSGTVKDVLLAAQNRPSGGTSFSFTAVTSPSGVESPQTFRAFYEAGFTSESGQYYDEGAYILSEHLSGNPYTVWQYYIIDANGVVINRQNEFTPYDDPKATVQDGQCVIWRCLSILSGPAKPNHRLKNQLKVV